MRIFHDGRTGSIRIIARDQTDDPRSLADDDAAEASEGLQPHTRGGRPVTQVPVPSSLPIVVDGPAASTPAFPDDHRVG